MAAIMVIHVQHLASRVMQANDLMSENPHRLVLALLVEAAII